MKWCSDNDNKGCESFRNLVGKIMLKDPECSDLTDEWNYCVFCGKPMNKQEKE